MRPSCLLALLVVGLAACDAGRHANPVKDALARTARSTGVGTSVAFRFPGQTAGDPKLYHLPGLEEVAWRFEGAAAPTHLPVGFASDDDLVYTLTQQRELVALDLATGRARVVDTAVALATLGPTGTTYVVYDSGTVAVVQHRAPTRWSHGFSAPPRAVWGAVRNRLIGLIVSDTARVLELLGESATPVRQRLPDGHVAVSAWGDLVAVATDSGIVTIHPADPATRGFVRLRPAPQLAAFSPSAHRIYATSATELLAVERFELAPLTRMPLPGPATALRVDPRGRLVLLRLGTADSVWVVDLARWRLVGAVQGSWDRDLPAGAADGTLVVPQGAAVVALSPDSLALRGIAQAVTGDRWLIAAWDPHRPALEFVSDTTVAELIQPTLSYWVQVSSTINQAWAEERAADLRRAGINATVLAPTLPDEPYRVVIGPHPTRDAAESIGRKLGLPYWIFTRDTTGVIP